MSTHPTIESPHDAVPPNAMTEQRLVMLIGTVLPIWCRHIVSIRRHSEQAVSEMLQACAHLRQQFDAQSLMHEPMDQLLQAFQYQDRLSQRMTLLEEDITRMLQLLTDTGQPIPTVDAWLSRLESHYAMQEQVHDHNGQSQPIIAHDAGQGAHFF